MTSDDNVVILPVAMFAENEIVDPDVDTMLFQQGFDDANAYLDAMPPTWAQHHASVTMSEPGPMDSSFDVGDLSPAESEEASYRRGYRAALYGFLRQCER